MLDRRDLLATTVALGATAALPAWAQPAPARDPALATIVDRLAADLLQASPENATTLGLDGGDRAPLKSRLDDRSRDQVARGLALAGRYRAELARLDRARLGPRDLTTLEAVDYALTLAQGGGRFAWGDNGLSALQGGALPYVVTQNTGVYADLPDFLDAQHAVATAADGEAYLARVDALPRALDQETARIAADAARGVIAPDFILDTTMVQLRRLRAIPAGRQRLVQSLAERTRAKALTGDWIERATRSVETGFLPALDRQIAAVAAARAQATHDAGVWKLPDGEAYYAWALQVGTTTALSAEAIHQTGLEQNAAIQARMATLLAMQGLTQGSVGERLTALTTDKRFAFANTDAGRAQVLDYIRDRIAATRALMPGVSRMPLKAEVDVRRVPIDIEDGAPQGYMNFAALDGSRPAIYYINLKTTANWPRWSLPTLTVHEALPGHAWQGAYLAERRAEIPTVFSLMNFNAFTEGWALYAEQLMDEAGLYRDDPFGELGYLQAQQFRACRLVVDTGLHAMRWTRERAIGWLAQNTGRSLDAVTSEIHRYCVWPGQACGYKVGHNEIMRLRASARAALGPRFDAAAFNDAVIQTAGVPLAVLAPAIDRFVARGGRA